MNFATVFATNDLNQIVRNEIADMNEYGVIDPNFWGARAVLNTVRDYLCSHTNPKHPHADEMTEYILRAETSDDEEDVSYCADVVTTLMTQDDNGKQYLNKAYENAIRNNPSMISDLLDDNKVQGAIDMMYASFFDMCLSSETIRPTEFVEIAETYNHGLSKTIFLADDVDKFLEIAKVGKRDTFTLGRINRKALYLELSITREDGATEIHPFIPVKWVRKVATTDYFMQPLIPYDTINSFYRKDLQE